MWLFIENYILPIGEFVVPVAFLLHQYLRRMREDKPVWPIYARAAAILPIMFATGGVRVVDTGNYGVQTQWGEVLFDKPYLEPGINWVYPWRHVQLMSSRAQEVHISKGDVKVITRDGLELDVDVHLSMLINGEYAARLYSAYGDIESMIAKLMSPAAINAIKTAGNAVDAKDAWEKDRAGFEKKIHDSFVATVIGYIAVLPEFRKLPKEELERVFGFPPAMLGPTKPPISVLEQTARQHAAEEALLTEQKLTTLAKAKQVTAQEEGKIFGQFILALPPGTTPADVAALENARGFRDIVADKRPIGSLSIVIQGGETRQGGGQLPGQAPGQVPGQTGQPNPAPNVPAPKDKAK